MKQSHHFLPLISEQRKEARDIDLQLKALRSQGLSSQDDFNRYQHLMMQKQKITLKFDRYRDSMFTGWRKTLAGQMKG